MQPRTVQINGHEMNYPYCESCERKMQDDSDNIKEDDARNIWNVRKRTEPS